MEYAEIALSFVIGLILVILLAWVFSLKTKGFTRLLFNSMAGIILMLAFGLFRIIHIPLNPLNGLIVGFLGVPGVIAVFVITAFF